MSFIFKITTTTSPQTFVIPCVDEGTFNATVDYGDGTGSQTVTAYNDANLTHSFATAGQHTITIDGTFPNIRFYDDAASRVLIDEVVDLGDVGWVNLARGFRDCTNLTDFNVGTADTSSVTTMQDMFRSCTSLTTLDLSNFDTSSVNNMYAMFYSCNNLTTLDVSSFDTSSVTNMGLMFHTCQSLTTLDVSNFDTSSVIAMLQMFLNCTSLTTLDVSNFDTSSVTDISRMFLNCTSLTNLDIKHFDISSVTNGTSFLQGANNALTTTAYDELLEAWAAQDVQPNVPWHFGNAQYTVETVADWYSPRSASSLSIINNKLVSIADSTAVFGAAQQIDNLIVGNVYKIAGKATCSNASAYVYIRVTNDSTITGVVFNVNELESVTANDTFIATATTLYVGVVVSGHAANDTVTIDAGITVKEITNYTEANAASEIEYSQENVFGAEEVVNGDFATDSDWNKGHLWTINNGTAIYSAVSGSANIWQNNITTTGKSYVVTVDVIQNDGSCSLRTNNGTVIIGDVINGTGLFSFIFSAIGSEITFRAGFNTDPVIIDNVSLKEITNAVEYKNIPQSARELYSLEDDTWVGSNELVVNGDFATNIAGYNTTSGASTITWDDGKLKAVKIANTSSWLARGIDNILFLEIGKTYFIKADVWADPSNQGATSAMFSSWDNVSTALGWQGISEATASTGFYYTAVSTGRYEPILSSAGTSVIGDIFYLDNVSVKEIIEVAS